MNSLFDASVQISFPFLFLDLLLSNPSFTGLQTYTVSFLIVSWHWFWIMAQLEPSVLLSPEVLVSLGVL